MTAAAQAVCLSAGERGAKAPLYLLLVRSRGTPMAQATVIRSKLAARLACYRLPCPGPMWMLPFTLLTSIRIPPLPSVPLRLLPTYPPCTWRGKSVLMPPLTVLALIRSEAAVYVAHFDSHSAAAQRTAEALTYISALHLEREVSSNAAAHGTGFDLGIRRVRQSDRKSTRLNSSH